MAMAMEGKYAAILLSIYVDSLQILPGAQSLLVMAWSDTDESRYKRLYTLSPCDGACVGSCPNVSRRRFRPHARRANAAHLLGCDGRAAVRAAGQAGANAAVAVVRQGAVKDRAVFAAGPPAAVLITALAPERPLGWPMTMSDRARALLQAPARDQPLLGRLAGRGSPVSVESLLALQPHLVLDAGTVDGIYSSAAQRVIPHGLKPRACASIALSRARRCGPSSAGPTTGHRTGSHRQLQGDEFRAANVGSGS
jgi:hypothetical protein